jgi:mono/diheme cytochrome c family protein
MTSRWLNATGRAMLAATVIVLATGAYRLPPERQRALAGKDAELVAANCSGCHSLDYITHQPPTMGPAFWTAEVTKMRTVYGAPVADADAPRIAAALAASPETGAVR